MSICRFKMYLSRLLGEYQKGTEDERCNPLMLHDSVRQVVGSIIMSKHDLGDPASYIPTFYQMCKSIKLRSESISSRMQQPLAHLYFITVLEHAVRKRWKLTTIKNVAKNLSDLCHSGPKTAQVVLHIEFQAVLQVLARLIVKFKSGKKLQLETHKAINVLFSNENNGGGKTCGHGMVIALHLYEMSKNPKEFFEGFATILENIDCLKPIDERLQKTALASPTSTNKGSFLLLDQLESKDELHQLYLSVKDLMCGIDESTNDTRRLEELAKEWSVEQAHTISIS